MTVRSAASRPPRVLVAEDEPVIGIDLTERLVEAGYSILGPFTRRREVEEWITHDTPDAAVLDMRLLDGSCEDAVRLLQKQGVPIVAFTGGGDIPEDLADMVVVTKPGSMEQVLEALKKLTSR